MIAWPRALVLYNSPGPPVFKRVSVPLVVGVALFMAAAFLVVVTFVVRAQRRPVGVGARALIGRIGEVWTPLEPMGQVQVGGELWSAGVEQWQPSLAPGTRAVVSRVEGLRLHVREAGADVHPPRTG